MKLRQIQRYWQFQMCTTSIDGAFYPASCLCKEIVTDPLSRNNVLYLCKMFYAQRAVTQMEADGKKGHEMEKPICNLASRTISRKPLEMITAIILRNQILDQQGRNKNWNADRIGEEQTRCQRMRSKKLKEKMGRPPGNEARQQHDAT
jgi:hypothetical protein